MDPHMDIAPATENDIPALVGLLDILFSQEAEFTPDHQAQERGLKRIITDHDLGFILVGKIGGRPVAMVNILFTVSTALGQRVAILEDMVVAPGYRSSGLGSALLDRAIDQARRSGCLRITLLTDQDNELAHRFYQGRGFTRSAMVPFRLSLTP